MASWTADAVIYRATQDGITWEVRTFANAGCLAITKRGKHGTLLDSRCEFDGTRWLRPPSPKVPKYLVKRLEDSVRELLA